MKKFILLIWIILIACCITEDISRHQNQAIQICKNECESVKNSVNLTNGPCLLDPISNLPDWVCDVAHNPRSSVDNQPENQCSSFRQGLATHFVEIDENCELIRVQ